PPAPPEAPAPPVAPPAPAPATLPGGTGFPPGHVLPPPPAPPGGAATFFRRVAGGDWAGAFRAAVWPLFALLVVTVLLAAPSYGQSEYDEDTVGFGDRFQISLALVLQSVGGDLEFEEVGGPRFGSGENWPAVDADEGYGSDRSPFGEPDAGRGGLAMTPLLVTAVWLLALYGGVRLLRDRLRHRTDGPSPSAGPGGPPPPAGPWAAATPWTRGSTAGLEAAARVTLLLTLGTLVLALIARPSLREIEVTGSLWAVPGTLLLAGVLSAVVLSRDEHACWLAARPGLLRLTEAFGTALRALAAALALCALILLVVYLQWDAVHDESAVDGEFSPHLIVVFLLVNLAVSGLGFGWGAPARMEAGSGSGGGRESFGLSDLGEAVGGWAVAGSLAAGAVCALLLGVLAARRHARAADRYLAGGVFLVLFLGLVAIGGVGMDQSGAGFGSAGQMHMGTEVSAALLFGLLWVAGGIAVGGLLTRLFTVQGAHAPGARPPGA
ncbi:zinc ribbon domain-containing protein, partial [Streptomyces sp. NPDC002490]|uniref:zinc ribbon domain-containing protein n=1 Tax=Streptomyces sp. NPDC002490 TaxID=3154416 RepID=UPI00332D9BD6